MSLVQARGLTKRYGDVTALDAFDLTVEPGRIVGLIGPNGSDKTTALKSILGLAHLDAGDLSVLGLRPEKKRRDLMRRTAYIADTGILPRWMRVAHLLDFMADVNPSFDRASAVAALEKTEVRLDKKILTLSKGMNVQLHLALVLAIDTELLVLDEPTLGLDILYRQQFYDSVLNDYFEEKRSILVTTHEVREIEHILTDVTFIHHGRNILDLATDQLAVEFAKVTTSESGAQALRALAPLSERHTLHGTEMLFRGADQDDLARHGEVATPNLPEIFVALVGDHL